jgi:hypothetical protein
MVRFEDEWMPLDTLTIIEDETLPSPIGLVPSEGYGSDMYRVQL